MRLKPFIGTFGKKPPVMIVDPILADAPFWPEFNEGSLAYIDAGFLWTPSDNWEVTGWFNLIDSASGSAVIIDTRGTGSNGMVIYTANGDFNLWSPIFGVVSCTAQAFNDGVWYRFRVWQNLGSMGMEIYNLSDQLVDSVTDTGTYVPYVPVGRNTIIGMASAASNLSWDGNLAGIKIVDNGDVFAYFQLNEGTGLTVYDTSGNGYVGTVNATTEEIFWP